MKITSNRSCEKMKKFVLGLVCGLILSVSSMVYASGSVEAFLFPVKFLFNGESKLLDSQFQVLNYKGYTYVPARFVAENMEGYIKYDQYNKIISINYISPYMQVLSDWQGYYPNFKVANLKLEKIGDDTNVTGQFTVHGDNTSNYVAFSLMFYNERGEMISKAGGGGDVEPGEIKSFESTVKGDITTYSNVKLELGIFNHVIKR
jgi:hypothetical protein